MKTFIFAMAMLFATLTTAMAGSAVDVYRDNAVMVQLNQLLTGERSGVGAVCRTQSGMLRYMLVGNNIKSMTPIDRSNQIMFKTAFGGTLILPASSCDMYRNKSAMIAAK